MMCTRVIISQRSKDRSGQYRFAQAVLEEGLLRRSFRVVTMDGADRWVDLNKLLTRPGKITGPGFEPDPALLEFLQNDARVLCVGAGGLGCELLKDLALQGFGNIDVIDMDTIDVSNLNRQFLFRMKDVGKSKAEVAAERIMQRVEGVTVTPHFCRIEEKPMEFYEQFHILVLGLDSLEARRFMNQVACSFLEYDDEGNPDMSTIKPMVDGGTEGLKGHARVILPGVTPCFECTLWLFPPQTKFPLCTLAETPRSPAHCIEYAHLIQWQQERADDEFDTDNEEHMRWVYEKALKRAEHFGIQGVTWQLTGGVVKNIIPAIASTNAIIAAACALETLKLITMCSTGINNYMMYVGADGVYTHTVAYERDAACTVCSSSVPFEVASTDTLQQVIDALVADKTLGANLSAPSISHGAENLYMRGVLEEATHDNLSKPIGELVEAGGVIQVNDKKLVSTMRVKLKYSDLASMQQ
ncbi:NEDD8-activating enzyme E1 catalytic subunit [Coccomyxa sp. Obi]|nr:NEDD8-activating enzyme E1 catalytic subunit [Coccomyxa sp. Obi]